MLSSKGFDLWANDYDKSVGLSEEENSYPFAGYKNVLNLIFNDILAKQGRNVLDIGFGTGTLATKLYENGCTIWGQDFSVKMIELAQAKMENARLFCSDFSKGLVEELKSQKYDAIIATYSIHHLTDEEKIKFLKSLLLLLNENGKIYIGDVAFETREDLVKCRQVAGEDWDEDEIYCVFEEMKKHFENITFTKVSECAGILEICR